MDQVICRHGVPECLVSDQGANLLSALIDEIYEVTVIQKLSTTAYHLQANGLVANFNRTLRAMLAKYATEYGTNWDDHLNHLLFVYRTKPHESTKSLPSFYSMGGMLAFLLSQCYPRDARHTRLTMMTTRASWSLAWLMRGKWQGAISRRHNRDRKGVTIGM